MNRIIKEELEKVRFDLPYYDDSTTQIIIEGNEVLDIPVEVNKEYIIMLNDYVLDKSSGLSANWNRGVTPKSKYLYVSISKIDGKMVRIDGCGYDMNSKKTLEDSYMDLWLPSNSFKVIAKY